MNTKSMTTEQLKAELAFRESILTYDASPEFLHEMKVLANAIASRPAKTITITEMWQKQFDATIQARANRLGVSFDEALASWREAKAKREAFFANR